MVTEADLVRSIASSVNYLFRQLKILDALICLSVCRDDAFQSLDHAWLASYSHSQLDVLGFLVRLTAHQSHEHDRGQFCYMRAPDYLKT